MTEETTDTRWNDPEYWREMYMRKVMVEAGQHRVLLVIAGGQKEPRRLAQEIVMSAGGVTDEILASPMWKLGSDLAYYVSAERAEGRDNPARVDRHD